MEAGAKPCLSSDWDVSSLSPFIGIQNAVTRTPQNISLQDAIDAYTINEAYLIRQEGNVGSLEKVKEADFIVLDKNIFETPVNDISEIQVLETYLRGNLAFEQ